MSVGSSMILVLLLMAFSWKFFTQSSQILSFLLTLEAMMLLTLLSIMLTLNHILPAMFFMVFFTLAVAEASMGLGLLIYVSRQTTGFTLNI